MNDNTIYNNFKLYLKPANKINISNTTIFSLDIETKGLNARAYWFGILSWITTSSYSKQGYYVIFEDHIKLSEFIMKLSEKALKNKKKIWIYGHNIEYDYIGVFKDNLFHDKIQYNFKPFIATMNDYLIFNDNMSLYPMSLKRLGNLINLHKFETPQDMIQGTVKEITKNDIKYCLRDTQIVLKGVEFYKQTINTLFGFKIRKLYTTPQVTIKTFQTYINKYNWDIPLFIRNKINSPVDEFNFIKLAFRGGRVIAFKKGKFKDCVNLDFNSMYPQIMKNLRLPDFNSQRIILNPNIKKTKEYLGYDGVIECKIEIPELNIGYLPIRHGKEQLYPRHTGIIKGIWTNFEIKQALSKGYKLFEVNKILFYEKNYDKYFENYIEKLYQVKSNDDKLKPIAKLLMNSLFGKFAQRNENRQFKTIDRSKIDEYSDWTLECHYNDWSLMSKKSSYEYPRWTQPYISAIITAKARDKLYSLYEQIEYKDLLYSDTDSIIITNFDKYKKILSTKLVPETSSKKEYIQNWNNINNNLGDLKIEKWGDCTIKMEKFVKIIDPLNNNKIAMAGIVNAQKTIENFDKGEFTIKVMNKIRGNLNNLDRVGTFYEKKITLNKTETKIDHEEEFSKKNLYYEETYY